MAIISTRQGLIDYSLRRLGEPVIEINVDEDQIEDKVDDALQVYQEFHGDATNRAYYQHQMTAANITNKYVDIPAHILYVTKMFPVNNSMVQSSNFFSFQYQFAMSDMHNMAGAGGGGGLAYLEQTQQHLALIDMKINGLPLISFSRRANRVYLHSDIEDGQLTAGKYIAFEVYQTVDPTTYSSVWNDMFMKDFTTALIKEQWGQNMSKFEGMQLPGGVTISGRQILEEAKGEITELRDRMRLEQEVPPDFFVG
tara:strand:- start:2381 stop:3142 length:762 start_codon:yes stop_codon:yes gene_type:complete